MNWLSMGYMVSGMNGHIVASYLCRLLKTNTYLKYSWFVYTKKQIAFCELLPFESWFTLRLIIRFHIYVCVCVCASVFTFTHVSIFDIFMPYFCIPYFLFCCVSLFAKCTFTPLFLRCSLYSFYSLCHFAERLSCSKTHPNMALNIKIFHL